MLRLVRHNFIKEETNSLKFPVNMYVTDGLVAQYWANILKIAASNVGNKLIAF